MTLREEARRRYPDFPWLSAGDRTGVENLMRKLGWLAEDEAVDSCEPAGDGNMNLTLRVRTNRRSLVLKQARPWVEKFDHIPAPWDRAKSEISFYRAVAQFPDVRSQMPRLEASDDTARTLLLEYLEGEGDFSDLYGGGTGGGIGGSVGGDTRSIAKPGAYGKEPGDRPSITNHEIAAAAHYLANLHLASLGGDSAPFANREMRALNHAHIYQIPFDDEGVVDLDALEPGLARVASSLRDDAQYRKRVEDTGRQYLDDGPCLLHGDYFPGSWLRGRDGLRVIDPEFCFYGIPEIDLGCAIAHFALANLPSSAALRFVGEYCGKASGIEICDAWVGRFASVEVMRRLIGVAQLPIPPTPKRSSVDDPPTGFRGALLTRSHAAMLEENFEKLWSAG